MFIHCIFLGYKKIYKGKGYGALLLDECIKDAEKGDKLGVAVVTRKGSFMAGKDFFLKKGFEIVGKAAPDFELLVKKFDKNSPSPELNGNWAERLKCYGKGLTIIRADQCPYTVKNVKEITETALQEYNIKAKVVNLKNAEEAQNSPCPFGTFCMIYDGKIVAEHPISKGRFKNIMKKN